MLNFNIKPSSKIIINRSFIPIIISFLLFPQYSCDTTEPTDNLKPGRRDYIWTVDTLDTQMNRIQSIWGSSPENVWAVGPGGLNANERLWHFDGNVWQPYQQALPITPECIYGTDQNNIWIGGNDANIYRFNGTVWNQVYSISRQDTTGNWIDEIWGKEMNNIYALGYAYLSQEPKLRSFILHFNGKQWNEIYFSQQKVYLFRIYRFNNNLFLSGIIQTQTIKPDTLVFYKYANNSLSEIYRNTSNNITFINLNQIGNEPYFLIGRDLNKYSNNNFIKIVTFNHQSFGFQVSGRNEKDMFIRMKDGLAHYNGVDIEYLFHFENNNTTILGTPLILESDVFYVLHDNINDLNLILRGHLKD